MGAGLLVLLAVPPDRHRGGTAAADESHGEFGGQVHCPGRRTTAYAGEFGDVLGEKIIDHMFASNRG